MIIEHVEIYWWTEEYSGEKIAIPGSWIDRLEVVDNLQLTTGDTYLGKLLLNKLEWLAETGTPIDTTVVLIDGSEKYELFLGRGKVVRFAQRDAMLYHRTYQLELSFQNDWLRAKREKANTTYFGQDYFRESFDG